MSLKTKYVSGVEVDQVKGMTINLISAICLNVSVWTKESTKKHLMGANYHVIAEEDGSI